jgi:hypothetical protein
LPFFGGGKRKRKVVKKLESKKVKCMQRGIKGGKGVQVHTAERGKLLSERVCE